MEAIELLRLQVRQAHEYLEGTMADVTPEQVHWPPPGTANPIGATYVHLLMSEDMSTNMLFKGGAPFFASTWAGRTGFSEPMPMPGPDWADYPNWARRVKIDLPAIREYAQAVFASTADYLNSLTSADLDRELDLTMLELGKQTLGSAISILIEGHTHDITGEISCLKGLQGARGYPA